MSYLDLGYPGQPVKAYSNPVPNNCHLSKWLPNIPEISKTDVKHGISELVSLSIRKFSIFVKFLDIHKAAANREF